MLPLAIKRISRGWCVADEAMMGAAGVANVSVSWSPDCVNTSIMATDTQSLGDSLHTMGSYANSNIHNKQYIKALLHYHCTVNADF